MRRRPTKGVQVHRSVVRPDGSLHLGEAARCLGFAPGQLVEITMNCTGSLLLVKSDDHDAIDLDATRLPAGMARLAVTGRHP